MAASRIDLLELPYYLYIRRNQFLCLICLAIRWLSVLSVYYWNY